MLPAFHLQKGEVSRDHLSPHAPSEREELKSSGCVPAGVLHVNPQTECKNTQADIAFFDEPRNDLLANATPTSSSHSTQSGEEYCRHLSQPDTPDHASHPWSNRRVQKNSVFGAFVPASLTLNDPGARDATTFLSRLVAQTPSYKPWL